MKPEARAGHLTDEELFGLALPAAGEPEALPAHVLQCARCGRSLQEWKGAVRQLAKEDVEPVLRRSAEEWRAVEDRTLAALARVRTRRHFGRLPWALGLAASLLLAVLLLPALRSLRPARMPNPRAAAAAELSPQDAADDALLREVATLSSGEDESNWNRLAPEPAAAEEDSL
jgi:hypothetical protein